MSKLLLLNGPNLNLLGEREPDVYGSTSLADIEARCVRLAEELGHELECFQSNAEHDLINRVQTAAADGVRFTLLNPGVDMPFIEIHLSNTFAREAFRHKSYFSDIATGCLFGLGAYAYELAIHAVHRQIKT